MNAIPTEVGYGIMAVAVVGFLVIFLNWGPNPMNQAVMFQHPTGVVPANVRDTQRQRVFGRVLWATVFSALFVAGLWLVNRPVAEFFFSVFVNVLWFALTVIAAVCQTLADAIGGVSG